MKPWPIYAVEIDGYAPEYFAARSAAAVRYQAWLAFSEHVTCTFRDFLHRARVVRRWTPFGPTEDGYRYVREAYGVDVEIGDQVTFRGEPSLKGRQGVVIYPGSSTAHVHVVIEGEQRRSTVHPSNIVVRR